jgi:hypothetical protein
VLVIIQAGEDAKPDVQRTPAGFSAFFLAFGTMAFAFGGTETAELIDQP